MTPLLAIHDLQVSFPGHDTVRGLNLTLNAGETLNSGIRIVKEMGLSSKYGFKG